jgi:hypothetical protein
MEIVMGRHPDGSLNPQLSQRGVPFEITTETSIN